MSDFPHGPLLPAEATPRITPELADEVIKALNDSGTVKTSPAIVLAVWTGSLVKYLVNGCEALDTLRNCHRARLEAEHGIKEKEAHRAVASPNEFTEHTLAAANKLLEALSALDEELQAKEDVLWGRRPKKEPS